MSPLLSPIVLRHATRGDDRALADLAALDSARRPEGPLLVVEQGGELRAALSLTTGQAIADPFHRTDHMIALLRVGARAWTVAPVERVNRRAARGRGMIRRVAPAR